MKAFFSIVAVALASPTLLAQVTNLPITSGLATYFKFDEAPLGTEGYGVVTNSATGGQNGQGIGDEGHFYSVQGQIGRAREYSGYQGDRVFVPDYPKMTNAITVAGWVKIPMYGYYPIVNNWLAENPAGSHGQFLFELFHLSLRSQIEVGADTVSASVPWLGGLNSWHHFAMSANGFTLSVYWNGQLVSSAGYFGSINTTPFPWLSLGANLTNQFNYFAPSGTTFKGGMDDLAIWNRWLSSEEISAIYSGGLSGKAIDQISPVNPALITKTVGEGMIQVTPSQSTYPPGTMVWLTAIPAAGWHFNNWSGHTNGAQILLNTMTLVMTMNTFVTATFTNAGTGCAPVPSGLVSWWPGAGNGSDLFGNNPGFPSNNVAFTAGKVGQAFRFSGANDYVAVSNSSSLNFGTSDSFTFETWLRVDGSSASGFDAFLDKRGVGGAGYLWEVDSPPGAAQRHIEFQITDGSVYPNVKSGPISTNTFYHVAVVLNRSTSTLSLYLDGVLQTNVSTAGLGSMVNDRRMFIGRGTLDYPTGAQPFHGVVDELAMYGRALSASEIQAIYAAGPTGKCLPVCTPAPAGLVSWWPGADNGNDIIGTNNGTVEIGAAISAGKVGQAFSFNGGTSSDVLIPASPSLKFTTQFTLEAWIKPDDVGNYRQIFSWLAVAPNQSYQLGLAPGGSLRMDISGDGNQYEAAISPGGVLTSGDWAHVASTFSPGEMKLYVNGNLVQTTATSITSLYTNTSYNMYIGTTPLGQQRFLGLIDEMSAYNRALSASEIQAIYTAGSAGKCLNPLYITSVNRTGNTVNLSWSAQKGMGYRVQYKTNLNSSTWSNLPPDITATNGTASQADSTLGNAAQRFYRVQLLQ